MVIFKKKMGLELYTNLKTVFAIDGIWWGREWEYYRYIAIPSGETRTVLLQFLLISPLKPFFVFTSDLFLKNYQTNSQGWYKANEACIKVHGRNFKHSLQKKKLQWCCKLTMFSFHVSFFVFVLYTYQNI